MTSPIEKAVDTLGIAMGHINSVFLTSTSSEEKEKLAFVNHLLGLQQGSLIAYIECIRDKRRHSRKNKKNKNAMIKKFIQTL